MEQQIQSVGIEPLVYVAAMSYHARRNDGNTAAIGGLIGFFFSFFPVFFAVLIFYR